MYKTITILKSVTLVIFGNFSKLVIKLNRIPFAQRLPDGSGYPAEALRQAQCDSRCAGFVAE